MTLFKNKISFEFLIVFFITLFGDLVINYIFTSSLISAETLLIKVLGALVVAMLFPQIKQLFIMKIDPEYTIFVIMGAAVASAFIGSFLTDRIRFLNNYSDLALNQKNAIIAECIEYGFVLIGLLALLLRAIIFMITTKKKERKANNSR